MLVSVRNTSNLSEGVTIVITGDTISVGLQVKCLSSLETLVTSLKVVTIVITGDTISVGLQVKCLSFLSDCNLTLNFSTYLTNFSI